MKKFTKQLELKLKKIGVYEQANKYMQNNGHAQPTGGYEYNSLDSIFFWNETSEGSTYWRDIHRKIIKMATIVPKNVIGGKLL